jgi:hypothetical protein
LQVSGIKTLGEPAVDRAPQLASCFHLSLLLP